MTLALIQMCFVLILIYPAHKDQQYSYCGYAPYSFEIEVNNDDTGSESRSRIQGLALLHDDQIIFCKRNFIESNGDYDKLTKLFIKTLSKDDKKALDIIIDYFALVPYDNE